jgi:hypothetical protein
MGPYSPELCQGLGLCIAQVHGPWIACMARAVEPRDPVPKGAGDGKGGAVLFKRLHLQHVGI